MTEKVSELFDENYFERGRATGVSAYMNYRWMPEQTIRMAHYLIRHLPIEDNQTVLDFGCAKGYLVKALRLLDIECYGVDISDYALRNIDSEVAVYCRQVGHGIDSIFAGNSYDWMIAKDVFEHLSEDELTELLIATSRYAKNLFAVVPLGVNDNSGRFVIPDYHSDVTHVTIKAKSWWISLFESCGWSTKRATKLFPGVKENWTKVWPDGNGFFHLESTS